MNQMAIKQFCAGEIIYCIYKSKITETVYIRYIVIGIDSIGSVVSWLAISVATLSENSCEMIPF